MKNTPYHTLTGELWGICCEDLGENWLHYNSTILYIGFNEMYNDASHDM